MNNNIKKFSSKESIKQRFLQIFLSFICLVSLFSCQSKKEVVSPGPKIDISKEVLEVAILMPLTGKDSGAGRQYNQLIKMGLEDGLETHVHVTSYDGSDEMKVLAAMDKILLHKTKIILGPLYSNLTALIADKAKANNIWLITMSNNPAIADKKLLVFGHAPLKQLTKIVNYFADNDYKDFIALLPSGRHAHIINQVMQNILIQKNSSLVASEFYDNIPESIEKAVVTVANNADNLNEMEETKTKPVIYISDEGKNLDLLFNSIHKHNLDKKAVIIGDNRIDNRYLSKLAYAQGFTGGMECRTASSTENVREDSSLGSTHKLPAEVEFQKISNENSEPIDIAFTGSLNIVNTNILDKAKNAAISHWSFMHAVAYDLGRITANYIGSKFTEEGFLAEVNSKTPYVGISGNILFIDSIAQREYDIIRREDGLYSTMAKAP